MSFVSIAFIVFILAFLLVYFLVPKKIQWIIILIGNIIFYLFAGLLYSLFLLSSILTTYLASLWIGFRNEKTNVKISQNEYDKDKKRNIRKKVSAGNQWIVAAGIVLNIAVLFVFKYGNTLLNITNTFFGLDMLGNFKFVLPIGISFYTFSSMGYLIDTYRETIVPEKNPLKYAAYISFFPIVLEGPLCSYSDVGQQILKGHDFDSTNAFNGFKRIVFGFFKKIVIADMIGIAAASIWANYQDYNGLFIFCGAVFYAIQIYFDFSGFMDISIGIAKVMGIALPENFDTPYFSSSVAEYWRRWHITLGAWFKNYLYYPLMRCSLFTKIKKSVSRKAGDKIIVSLSLALVWISIGLWHGSTLNFLIHGCYYGILLIMDVLLSRFYQKIWIILHIKDGSKLLRIFRIVRTFVLVCWGYYLFASPNLQVGVHMFISGLQFWDVRSFANFFDVGLTIYGYIIVLVGIIFVWLCISLFREEMIGRIPYFKYNLSRLNKMIQVPILAAITIAIVSILIYEMSLGDFASSSIYFNF